eukprot:4164136-Alexandrium_andersonii.AAC.1
MAAHDTLMQHLETDDLTAFWDLWSGTLLKVMQQVSRAHGGQPIKHMRGMNIKELPSGEVWRKPALQHHD